MDIHQRYILPAQVVLIPSSHVTEADKEHLLLADTDVVITHRHTRKRSKIISEETAALLKQFLLPQTPAAAIFRHAVATRQDAQALAGNALAAITAMAAEGYLVPEASLAASPHLAPLSPGDQFGRYRVTAVCQVMENSSVYQVQNRAGEIFALKLFTPAHPNFAAETMILEKLDGSINPALIEKGNQNGVAFFVVEWRHGSTSDKEMAHLRNYVTKTKVLTLLDRCIGIADAFAHLHRQGVLHGDVHPNNVLMDANGQVSIVDYDSAVTAGCQQRTLRGGIDFYYEPELALALLQGNLAVPITDKGEQYAVAVLLFRLITGHHYLSFSYEPERAYRQISEDAPLAFSVFDIDLPQEVQGVFAKALAKDPRQRFDSLAAFSAALIRGRQSVVDSPRFFVPQPNDQGQRFIQFLLQRYGPGSGLIKKGFQHPPACSINYGAAGIAYFLYRVACIGSRPDCLDAADVWAGHAASFDNRYNEAFYAPAEDITAKTVGCRSLYHSATGVYLVQALISSARGDTQNLSLATTNYLAAGATSCGQDDLTLGKAGLLVGSALLLQELKLTEQIDTTRLIYFTNGLMDDLWQHLDVLPPIGTENLIGYFGMAHGWAGLLYGSLLWCHVSATPLPAGLPGRLQALLSLADLQQNRLRWPVSATDRQFWPGWCHGNAGYTHLWGLAWQHFSEARFLTAAMKACACLPGSRQLAPHLCCGLAGEAYALLKLYRLTSEPQYLLDARQLADRAYRKLSSAELRNHSLYRGEVGIGVLLADLLQPEMARMPLFE